RLLVITYHFGSNGAVGGLRWTGITKYLVRLGWEVRVITAAPPEHASVESCPRFWTILDACRLLRRLAARQSLASFPAGSRGAADGGSPNAQQLAAALTERYPDVPVVCVPNGVDPAGLPGRAPRPYAGLSVAYTGTLYAGRDLGPVVQALRLFLARHPEAARA